MAVIRVAVAKYQLRVRPQDKACMLMKIRLLRTMYVYIYIYACSYIIVPTVLLWLLTHFP